MKPPSGDAIADQIAYYRARAPEYDATFGGAHDPELIAALDALHPRGDVLELACGTGAWTESLVRHPIRSVHCIDAAPEMLALHERRIDDGRVTREVANIFEWSPSRRYDLVTFSFWLSHVPPARFEPFWRMVASALEPGAEAFFVDEDERGLAHEQPGGDPEYPTVQRRMRSGVTMTAIKVYDRADDLSARLDALGWTATVLSAGERFYWGRARLSAATPAPG